MALLQGDGSADANFESLDTSTTDQSSKKNFSCVLCAQRKVRCDKLPGGCANCTKVRVPCVYKAPAPPRRRKKGVRDVDVTTRLRLYEDALRRFGVDPDDLVKEESKKSPNCDTIGGLNGILGTPMANQSQSKDLGSEAGVLVSDKFRTRYLENGIWTSLKGEFRDTKEILEDSSDDDLASGYDKASPESFSNDATSLLFGSQTLSIALRSLHPNPIQMFQLWQSYLDNVNPLVKVFHAPSVQQMISEASGNLDQIPREVEALLFAIYCITVESLSDSECIAIMGEHKAVLNRRFRLGAQQSLINANVLRSSKMMVLKAFTIYILSLQNYDARVIWILSGIVQRIGQRIGLHRDAETLGLPPFQVEMRRRLWWQIMMLEGFSQKLAGTGASSTILMGNVRMPSNVNDSDLFLAMKEMPKEHEGATEMMFFLIRCLTGEFLMRSADTHTTFDGVWHRLTSSAIQVAIKDKAIDELHAMFQRRFLQYCDPSIAWHLLCSHLAQAIISMMRFMAHSAEYYSIDMPISEKDLLFDLALQVCAAQTLAYTMKEMQGFMWHVNLHFQWKAFIYLVSELRYRTKGDKVEQAWKVIEKSYEFHPSFGKEMSVRALPVAVSNLTLKAWEAYTLARDTSASSEPYFIQLIRSAQSRSKKSDGSTHASDIPTTLPQEHQILHDGKDPVDGLNTDQEAVQHFIWDSSEFDASLGMIPAVTQTVPLEDTEQMSWSTWDNLLVDFQSNSYDDPPIDLGAFDFGQQT